MGDLGGLFGGGGDAASAAGGAGLTDADFAGLTDADVMGSGASAASGLFGGASGGLGQFAQAMSALSGGGSSGGGAAGSGGGAAGGGASGSGLTDTAEQALSMSPAGGAGGAGASGGTQSGTQPGATPNQPQQSDQPPKSALDELRKLLQGGPKPPAGATADPFKTGGGAGAGPSNQQPPWAKPMANPPFRPTEGGAIPGWTDPTAGDPETDLPQMPGRGGAVVPSGGQPPAATSGAAPPAAPAAPAAPSGGGEGIEGLPPPGDPSTLVPPGWRGMANPIGRAAMAAGGALQSSPAETGELPYGYGGSPDQPARPVTPTPGQVKTDPQGNPITAAGTPAAQTPTPPERPASAPPPDPKTGLPSDPVSKKPLTPDQYKKWFDHATKGDTRAAPRGGDVPTKVPTKKGGAEAAPAAAAPPATPPEARGGGQAQPGSILSNLLGGGANPSTLLQLATAVLPLIMGGMGGGGGRRGGWRHRGGGFGRFGGFRGGMNAMRGGGGHGPLPGFRGGNLRPGYYPNHAGGFHYHPGGFHEGWPAHPNWGGQGGSQGGGGDMSGLAGLLGGQGGGASNGGGGGSSGGGGASGNYTGPGSGSASAGANVTAANGPWSDNSFLSTLVGAESGGRQGPNVRGDGGQAKGFFQFHDGTWQRYAQNVPGASQYASAEDAPPEVQQQVAMSAPIREWGPRTKQILHAKFGAFDEHQTIGQLAGQFGGGGGTTRMAATPPAAKPAPAAPPPPAPATIPDNVNANVG